MTRDPAAGSPEPPDPERIESLVRSEQVRALYERLPVAQATVLLNASVVVLVTWGRSSPRLLLSWLACVWVIAAARIASGIRYRRSTRDPGQAGRWERVFTVGAALNGLGWGVSPLLLSGGSPVEYVLFLAFVLAGMTAGAALSNASHQPAFVAFLVPTLAPVTALFFRAGDRLHLGMAAALVVFAIAVTAISRSGGRALAEASRLRFRNADLAERLATSAAELERRVAARTSELEASVAREREAERQLVSSIRLASLGTLAAAVAHEVNNPLAAVSSNLTFVRQEFPRAGAEPGAHAAMLAALDDATTGLERVKHIVRYLNDTSRLQLRAVAEPVDLHAAIELSVGIAERELRARALLVRAYGDVPTVQAGHVCLVQVFLDLLQLAAESIPQGDAPAHHIRIGTRPDPATGFVVVDIEAAARAATGAQPEHVWDARALPTLDGPGFELSMCSDLLARFGGRLEARGREGAGTRFTIWLRPAERGGATPGSA
jgi:signal transduction histidine kinase